MKLPADQNKPLVVLTPPPANPKNYLAALINAIVIRKTLPAVRITPPAEQKILPVE